MGDNSKHYIRFNDDVNPRFEETPEFVGYNEARFSLEQADDRMGRDEVFTTGIAQYKSGYHPQFEKIHAKLDQRGFEIDATHRIEVGGETIDLDFDTKEMESDLVDTFSTNLVNSYAAQKLKDRADIKIKVNSDETLDGDPITPLTPSKVLFKAFPTVQVSKWKTSAPDTHFSYSKYTKNGPGPSSISGVLIYQNTANTQEQGDIKNSVSNLYPYVGISTLQVAAGYFPRPTVEALAFLDLQNNLSDVQIEITDLDLKVQNFIEEGPSFGFDGGSAAGSTARVSVVYTIGDDVVNNTRYQVFAKNFGDSEEPEYTFPSTLTFTPPDIARGKRLYIYVETVIWGKFIPNIPSQTTPITEYRFYQIRSQMADAKIKITGTETAYNTIVDAYRYIDVKRYVVKALSGLDIVAPSFDVGSDLYRLWIIDGNGLRRKRDKPFSITFEDINNIDKQFKADYEITPEMDVFFGLYDEFYTSNEIAFFNEDALVSFGIEPNPRMTCNKYRIKFDTYQSQKENSQAGNGETLHGEAEFFFQNKKNNAYEVNIGWTMDAPAIEQARRAAIQEAASTVTQDDDKKFGLDVVDPPNGLISFTETDTLLHTYNEETNQLSLKIAVSEGGNQSFTWDILGITINTPFVINLSSPPAPNQGQYNVANVGINEILLNPVSATPTSGNDGERSTKFTYGVLASTIAGVSAGNEGLATSGIAYPDKFPNLNYTIMQSTFKYHWQHLASINLYHANELVRNTEYKNNPDAVINGLREGGQVISQDQDGNVMKSGIVPAQPILTGMRHKNIVWKDGDIDFATWLRISRLQRQLRGFVRFIDTEGIVRRTYAQSMYYDNAADVIGIEKGEEGYVPTDINIVDNNNGTYSINNEYIVTKVVWEAQGEKYKIKDREGYLLYNPLLWNRIAVNGDLPQSQTQLEQWLSLL